MSEIDPSTPEAAPPTSSPLLDPTLEPPSLTLPDAAPDTALDATPTPAPLPPKPTLRPLFIGDDGLRAGWSVLLFLILLYLVGRAAGFLVKHLHLLPPPVKGQDQPMTARVSAIGEALSFTIVAIPAFLMSLIERRPFSRFGLSAARLLPDFLTGIFWGFTALSALVGTLYLTHALAFDGLLLHGSVALLFALKWGLVFLFVGLFEEFFTRGYLQYTVGRGVAGITRTFDPTNQYSHAIGFWVAAFIFSVCLFMGGHLLNPGENKIGIAAVGIVGIVFAFSLYRTGTLWWAIGVHTAWDWAQSYFYGTPDSGTHSVGHLIGTHPIGSTLLSGGPDGPEGSILVIPTLLLLALVIHFTLPRRHYPLTPDQSPPLQSEYVP